MKYGLEDYTDTKLYDTFRETGSMLSARLSYASETTKNENTARQYAQELREVNSERIRTDPNDRNKQINYINNWEDRCRKLVPHTQ